MFGKATGAERVMNAISTFTSAKKELETGINELQDQKQEVADQIYRLELKEGELNGSIAGAVKVLDNINKIIGG